MEEPTLVQVLVDIIAVSILLVWPAVWTIKWRRWGWLAVVVLLPAVGGFVWLVAGWRKARDARDAERAAGVAATG